MQVGRGRGDGRGLGAQVVGLVQLGDLVDAAVEDLHSVALHHQPTGADSRRQCHGLADAVVLAMAQAALLLVLAQQPFVFGQAQIRVVGQPDPVGPVAAECVAAVADGVAEAVAAAGRAAGGGGDGGHYQVRRADAQHRHRPGLVVVVVGLVRVVGVEVAGQRVFQHRVVGVAPDGDEVLARANVVGDLHVERAGVVVAHRQCAGVADLAEPDVALGGRRAALVHRQPDAVGPGHRGRVALR